MKYTVSFFFLVVMMVGFALAEQGVRGYVFKGLSTEPAVGAHVLLTFRGDSVWVDTVITDTLGYYSIVTPYTGQHQIRAWTWYQDGLWTSGQENVTIPENTWVDKNLVLTPP